MEIVINRKPFPVKLSIIFYMEIAKSLSVKKRNALNGTLHKKRPDTDNLIKTYKDAFNGVLYKDDSQVCVYGEIKKIYSFEPRVEVKIFEIEGVI